ncbi:cytochrome b5-like heme/steroid binding domain-containing protein [Crepidotus variabilis]|uniref:Cytochrome b5-like heme/steroid binding domain-containing protein n=1 Tax=Crepidotus variabilis TaxID=179855 RepID=A0A9P6ESM4_9AGAR|nr:cytochrome b5-like heme/steroid binding domain-containing protein [Crepidotus variabilis]
MTSYLRSWLYSGTSSSAAAGSGHDDTSLDVPTLARISPPPDDEEDEGDETETERDNDLPPAFPALNSAQRMKSSSVPKFLTDSQLMPPPPPPSLAIRQPGVPASSSLAVPTRTEKAPTKSKKGKKVELAPGYGPLDWAALKSSGVDLRGVDTLLRIPPSVLKQHRKRDDAWSAFNGKVYNITPYLQYHPGGEKELMRVAGRDGTKLFAETHAWVNAEFMLDSCMVGFLIPEPAARDSD